MNVGLPGTGIGGMFYLLSALCMPLVEAVRSVRDRDWSRWRVVGRQLGLAVGMAAGIWTGARVLAVALAGSSLALAALHAAGVAGRITPDFLRAATLAVSLGTLGAVIVGVWIAKLWVHGWGGPRARSRKRGAMAAASRPRRPGRTARKRIPEYDAA